MECVEAIHAESVRRVHPAPPAKTTSDVSPVPREVVGRVAPANTRQRREQQRVLHARMLQRVRLGPTVSTVTRALKGAAQGPAEGVQPVNIASSARVSRRDAVPRAQSARTRRAQDQRHASSAQSDISAPMLAKTSNFARSLRDDTVLLHPYHQKV